jgi:hypothetical protein
MVHDDSGASAFRISQPTRPHFSPKWLSSVGSQPMRPHFSMKWLSSAGSQPINMWHTSYVSASSLVTSRWPCHFVTLRLWASGDFTLVFFKSIELQIFRSTLPSRGHMVQLSTIKLVARGPTCRISFCLTGSSKFHYD